jgi:hypothetical protein
MSDLFSGNFMPHGHCYLWKPEIVWLHVVSDAIITMAYFSIPLLLVYVVYKTKGGLPMNWLFLLFAIFILACGTTHVMEIVNVWKSEYLISGIIKAITAITSILTAIAMLPVLPKVIKTLQEAENMDKKT